MLALVVLSHDHEINGAVVTKRRTYTRQGFDRTKIDVLLKLSPDGDQQTPESLNIGNIGHTDGTEEDRIVTGESVEPVNRQHPPVPTIKLRTPLKMVPVEAQTVCGGRLLRSPQCGAGSRCRVRVRVANRRGCVRYFHDFDIVLLEHPLLIFGDLLVDDDAINSIPVTDLDHSRAKKLGGVGQKHDPLGHFDEGTLGDRVESVTAERSAFAKAACGKKEDLDLQTGNGRESRWSVEGQRFRMQRASEADHLDPLIAHEARDNGKRVRNNFYRTVSGEHPCKLISGGSGVYRDDRIQPEHVDGFLGDGAFRVTHLHIAESVITARQVLTRERGNSSAKSTHSALFDQPQHIATDCHL